VARAPALITLLTTCGATSASPVVAPTSTAPAPELHAVAAPPIDVCSLITSVPDAPNFPPTPAPVASASHPRSQLHEVQADIHGPLPAEVVQRIVRQNFGRFRLCYDKALGRDPSLTGRITAHVVVDPTGAVVKSEIAPGGLADDDARACMKHGFDSLSYPQSDGASTDFRYAIEFSPAPPAGPSAPAGAATEAPRDAPVRPRSPRARWLEQPWPMPAREPVAWVRRLGGPGNQEVLDAKVDAAGRVVLLGVLHGSADIGAIHLVAGAAEAAALFVAWLDPEGDPVSARAFRTTDPHVMAALAPTSDGDVVVAGTFHGELDLGGEPLRGERGPGFVVRLGPSGAVKWSRLLQGPFVTALAAGPSNTMFVTGAQEQGSAPNSAGAFVAKVGPDGAPVFSLPSRSPGTMGVGIDVDALGRAFVLGRFGAEVDFGLGPAKNEDRATGTFVLAVAPDGQPMWNRPFTTHDGNVEALTATAPGRLTVAGRAVCRQGHDSPDDEVPADGFLVPIDSGSGATTSATGLSSDQSLVLNPWVVAIDPAGNTLFATQELSYMTLGSVTPEGHRRWARVDRDALRFPWLTGRGLPFDRLGRAILAGTVQGPVDFGTGPLAGDRDTDIVLMAVAP
jgi:hypothetical protein